MSAESAPAHDEHAPRTGDRSGRASLAVAVAAAVALWIVFAPANMSPDSWVQYGEAVARRHADWHPPVMSIVLRLVFAVGGSLSFLTLVQCVGSVLVLRRLALETLLAFPRLAPAPRRAGWIATGVTLVVLSPLTPSAFVVTTFWKDEWQMAALAAFLAGALSLRRRAATLGAGRFAAEFAALALVGGAAGLPRYNAVVVLPVFGAMLACVAAARAAPIALRWIALPLPLLVFFAADGALARAFDVRHSHRDFLYQTLDLVGMCAQKQERLADFPYLAANLAPGALEAYRPGECRSIYIQGRFSMLSPEITADDRPNPALDAEHRRAMTRFPLEFARVKVTPFLRLLNPGAAGGDYFASGCEPNEHGLAQSAALAPVRRALHVATMAARDLPLLRWFSSHALWFDVNLAAFAAALWRLRKRRDTSALFLASALAVPLVYAAGFLVATLDMDHRFLYPSATVLMVPALALAAAALPRLRAAISGGAD